MSSASLNIQIGVDGLFEKLEAQLHDFSACNIQHAHLIPRKWYQKNIRPVVDKGQVVNLARGFLERFENCDNCVLFLPRFLDFGTVLNLNPKPAISNKVELLAGSFPGVDVTLHLFLPTHASYLYSTLQRRQISGLDSTQKPNWETLLRQLERVPTRGARIEVWDARKEDEVLADFLSDVCEVEPEEAARVAPTLTNQFAYQKTEREMCDAVSKFGWDVGDLY